MSANNALEIKVAGNEETKVDFTGKEELLAKLTKVVAEGEVEEETKVFAVIKKEGEEEKKTELATLNKEKKEADVEFLACSKCNLVLKVEGKSAIDVKGEFVEKQKEEDEEKKEEKQ